MKKLVVTGGPCAGKTTVINAIQDEFRNQVTLVPEVASMLLSSGFPVPGRDVEWSFQWQVAFEKAIVPVQEAIEEAKTLEAIKKGHKLLICDRGTLDTVGYLPNGFSDWKALFPNANVEEICSRYLTVIHLESLATANPDLYGRTGNENRFEPLDRAKEVELAMRESWKNHPKRIFIAGNKGVENKVSQVIGIVRFLLAD